MRLSDVRYAYRLSEINDVAGQTKQIIGRIGS